MLRTFRILAACLALAAPAFADATADAPLAPTHTNSIGMELVLIPAGTFQMGATNEELAAVCGRGASWGNEQFCRELRAHEQPRVEAKIEQPFYLGKYEVTRAQWREVMGDDAGEFEGDDLPAHGVSWNGAREFIGRLNAREGHGRYRLPTEAEWEYAARAGTETAYSFGDDPTELGRYAWHSRNAGGRPHPVGRKEPNPWGLFDIHGNVWEWTCSIYYPKYYNYVKWPTCKEYDSRVRTTLDPSARVMRGCSWANPASVCRSAERHRSGDYSQQGATPHFGFRLAMDVADDPDPPQAARRTARTARISGQDAANILRGEGREEAASPDHKPDAADDAGQGIRADGTPLDHDCMNRCFDEQSACMDACANSENCPSLCGNLQNACLADCGQRATAAGQP